MSSCPKEILEIAHTISHMCQSDFSLVASHGYFDHDEEHEHQLISAYGDKLPSDDPSPTPTKKDNTNKKKQTVANDYPIISSSVTRPRHRYIYLLTDYEIYLNLDTPPPVYSIVSI